MHPSYSTNKWLQLIEIMNVASSVSVVFVWGAVCLAYIRYYIWSVNSQTLSCLSYSLENRLKRSRSRLVNTFARYNRWDHQNFGASTLLPKIFQPYLALFGFIGCFVTMFVFTTSLFWIGRPRPQVVVAFEAIPILLVLFWLSLKLRRYLVYGGPSKVLSGKATSEQRGFWWVDINQGDILRTINAISYLKDNQRDEEIELRDHGE